MPSPPERQKSSSGNDCEPPEKAVVVQSRIQASLVLVHRICATDHVADPIPSPIDDVIRIETRWNRAALCFANPNTKSRYTFFQPTTNLPDRAFGLVSSLTDQQYYDAAALNSWPHFGLPSFIECFMGRPVYDLPR